MVRGSNPLVPTITASSIILITTTFPNNNINILVIKFRKGLFNKQPNHLELIGGETAMFIYKAV